MHAASGRVKISNAKHWKTSNPTHCICRCKIRMLPGLRKPFLKLNSPQVSSFTALCYRIIIRKGILVQGSRNKYLSNNLTPKKTLARTIARFNFSWKNHNWICHFSSYIGRIVPIKIQKQNQRTNLSWRSYRYYFRDWIWSQVPSFWLSHALSWIPAYRNSQYFAPLHNHTLQNLLC